MLNQSWLISTVICSTKFNISFSWLFQHVESSPEDKVASTAESALCHALLKPLVAEVHNAHSNITKPRQRMSSHAPESPIPFISQVKMLTRDQGQGKGQVCGTSTPRQTRPQPTSREPVNLTPFKFIPSLSTQGYKSQLWTHGHMPGLE